MGKGFFEIAASEIDWRKGGEGKGSNHMSLWRGVTALTARMRTNIHDPLKNGKRASDYHRLSTAEAQPEADVFCVCQVPVWTSYFGIGNPTIPSIRNCCITTLFNPPLSATHPSSPALCQRHWRAPQKLLHFGCECFLTAMEEYS